MTMHAKPKIATASEIRCEIGALPTLPNELLTPQQLGARLAVPTSWIREKCRERARRRDRDPLPVVRLGKYTRFSWPAVQEWLARQSA